MKLSDTKNLSRFTLLQVGESSHGKTTRSLSAAIYGPIKFLDIDDKLVALRGRISPEVQALVDVEIPRSYDAIAKAIKETDPSKFATIVLDTWSAAHELTIEKHKALNPKQVAMQIQDWGAVKQLNRQLLGLLFTFPGNVIINTHVGKDKNTADQQVLTVGTSGSFGAEMPRFFNETHYLSFSGGKYKVRGNKSDSIVANTSLPDKLLDPTGHFLSNTLDIFSEIAYKVGK